MSGAYAFSIVFVALQPAEPDNRHPVRRRQSRPIVDLQKFPVGLHLHDAMRSGQHDVVRAASGDPLIDSGDDVRYESRESGRQPQGTQPGACVRSVSACGNSPATCPAS